MELLTTKLKRLKQELEDYCNENHITDDNRTDFIDNDTYAMELQTQIENIEDYIQEHYGEH